jgi:hypothetical protein
MAGCVLIGKADNWHQIAADWLLAVVSVALMTATVRFWAAGFFGFIAYGALRSVAGVFFADSFHVPKQYLLFVSASIVVMAVLSHRFISKHVQITAIERVSLVLAAMCVLITVLLGNTYRGIVVFNVGNVALLASWWKLTPVSDRLGRDCRADVVLIAMLFGCPIPRNAISAANRISGIQ